ncbi:NUDIX domain-containing protein [Candidatus Saccharibacteria bacterium]|nr:MAG: NUDIX domain-containing protein [Candidatus Saccharibacteria bacterium]
MSGQEEVTREQWIQPPLGESLGLLALEASRSAAYFGDYVFEENEGVDRDTLTHGLGRLAAELWELPDPNWGGLTDRGGYVAYLDQVEEVGVPNCLVPEYGTTIADGEAIIEDYAGKHKFDLVYVSGVTGVKQSDEGVTEVFLSRTSGKDWTYQPHGGGRTEGEGSVAALLREVGEEAGWDAAVALLQALKKGTAYYAGYYASRIGDVLGEKAKGANTLLAIQCFIVDGRALEGVKLKPGSDSGGAEWLNVHDLPEDFITTTQMDYWLRTYFSAEVPKSKYTHPLEGYDGVPRS